MKAWHPAPGLSHLDERPTNHGIPHAGHMRPETSPRVKPSAIRYLGPPAQAGPARGRRRHGQTWK